MFFKEDLFTRNPMIEKVERENLLTKSEVYFTQAE